MNATTESPPAPLESCLQRAAGGHSRLIVLHYYHSGHLINRGGPEDAYLGGRRGFLTFMGCLVVLENVLVLAAILLRMRSRHWIYYCLVNIALSDMLMGAAYLANVLLSGPRTFQLAPAQWFLLKGLLFMALAASTFSLLFTAAECFATMVRPVAESRSTKTSRVYGFIGLCWLLAALLGLLPLLGWNCVCAFPRCSNQLPLYAKKYILFCVAIFSLVLVSILLLYGAIFRVVRAYGRQDPRPAAQREARQLLNMVLRILVAFVIFRGPLFGLLLADVFGSNVWAQEYLRGMDWVLELIIFNSVINPLIYFFRSREDCRAWVGFLCGSCLRLGLRGPGDCLARAAEAPSGVSTTDSSLRPRDSFRGSRFLSFLMREPLSSIASEHLTAGTAGPGARSI